MAIGGQKSILECTTHQTFKRTTLDLTAVCQEQEFEATLSTDSHGLFAQPVLFLTSDFSS